MGGGHPRSRQLATPLVSSPQGPPSAALPCIMALAAAAVLLSAPLLLMSTIVASLIVTLACAYPVWLGASLWHGGGGGDEAPMRAEPDKVYVQASDAVAVPDARLH